MSLRKMGTGAFLEMSVREVSISYPGGLVQGHTAGPRFVTRWFRNIHQAGQHTANVPRLRSKATNLESIPVYRHSRLSFSLLPLAFPSQ
jgi:hypothetical protein